jgi:AcrR family transcriptional regulator
MSSENFQQKRRYDASSRQAAAARRQHAVVAAARDAFEQKGWAGVTMREISEAAGVSHKTVEAVFGTKAALLKAAVDYAIRGDVEAVPIAQRESARAIDHSSNAAEMLRLHARHLRAINARSARIVAVVEQAVAADAAVAELWQRINHNRADGVRWATETLLSKPGRRPRLRRRYVETVFWVVVDWGTYRTLTEQAGLDDDGYENWLRAYYAATLLPQRQTT